MTRARLHEILAALLVWQGIAAVLFGLGAGASLLSEPRTFWSFLFLGFEALLLGFAFTRIVRFQRLVATWLASAERRLGL